MEYTDQSSGSIRLYLTKGQFDLNQFTILADVTFAWRDLSVSFGILGESHYITFTHGEAILNEICACTDAEMPESVRIIENDFLANLSSKKVVTSFQNYSYRFSFDFRNWEEGSIELEKLRKKREDPATHLLHHVFPRHETDIDDPVTEVYITEDSGLTIASVHTYPNERMMVFTTSTLGV